MRMILCVLILAIAACGSSPKPAPATPPPKSFSMKTYTFVLLKRGPAWSPEQTPETKKLFEGHMANIKAMAASGKLLIAGPFDADEHDTSAPAGLFIFDTTSIDEVKHLLAGDPAIGAGRLTVEIYPWYGPAGLTYDGREQAIAP